MPKKRAKKKVEIKKDNKKFYALGALILFFVAAGASVVAYFTAEAESATKAGGITATVTVMPRLNMVDLDFLKNNKLKFSLDKSSNYVRNLSAGDNVITLSAVNLRDELAVSNQFIKDYARFFGVSDKRQLILLSSAKDELGISHIKYQQKINGVPVFGGDMAVHVKNDLSVKSASAKVLTNISVKTSPKLTAVSAGNSAKRLWQGQFGGKAPDISSSKLFVLNKKLLDDRFEDKNYLVWEITANDSETGGLEYYYIDAATGKLVEQVTGVKSIINRRIFNCHNNRDRQRCTGMSGGAVAAGDRGEGQAAVGVTDVDNAYEMVRQSHSYFENTFGVAGANRQNGIGDNTGAHSRTSTDVYANWLIPRSWGYNCPNSFFSGNKLLFCATTVNLPIMGHEYGHAVSNFNGPPLIYSYQSGAIEEAMADIFGQGVENFITGSSSWRIGPTGAANSWRNLANPTSLGDPDRFYSNSVYCGADDEGGVHTNSTVISYAAYLMSTGGRFNQCSIEAIGQDRMERIFYRALDRYLTSASNFDDLYDALNDACGDLYQDMYCAQVRKAMQAVQADQPGRCSGVVATARPTCYPPYMLSASAIGGWYKAGDTVRIQFKFSKPVKKSGVVEARAVVNSDRTTRVICMMNLSTLTDIAACDYVVADADTTGRLYIDRIELSAAAPILDGDLSVLTNIVPEQNITGVGIDTAKPTGDFTINSGDKTTENPVVTLKLAATDELSGVEKFRVSNNSTTYSKWMDMVSSTQWNLYNANAGGGITPNTVGDYLRKVYVQFIDKAGNVSLASSDSITYAKKSNTLLPPAPENNEEESVTTSVPLHVILPTTTLEIIIPITKIVRTPDFKIAVKQDGSTIYLTGEINYWGKGGDCEGPRTTSDPIIARWGDGTTSHPSATKSKIFSNSHTYKKGYDSYDLSVTVTNGCYGSATKKFTVKL